MDRARTMSRKTLASKAKKVANKGSFAAGNKAGVGPKPIARRFITQHLISMMNEEISMMTPDLEAMAGAKDQKKVIFMRKTAQRLHFFCEKLFELALDGDLQAIKYITDRIEGAPIQTMAMTAEDFDPERLAAERKRLDEARANLHNMTDDERTAVYFQALRQVPGSSGSSQSH